jgi:hypothetical protein
MTNNVIHLYDARPDLVLEHIKRSTGLDFDALPQNLAELIRQSQEENEVSPPILTDVVETPIA